MNAGNVILNAARLIVGAWAVHGAATEFGNEFGTPEPGEDDLRIGNPASPELLMTNRVMEAIRCARMSAAGRRVYERREKELREYVATRVRQLLAERQAVSDAPSATPVVAELASAPSQPQNAHPFADSDAQRIIDLLTRKAQTAAATKGPLEVSVRFGPHVEQPYNRWGYLSVKLEANYGPELYVWRVHLSPFDLSDNFTMFMPVKVNIREQRMLRDKQGTYQQIKTAPGGDSDHTYPNLQTTLEEVEALVDAWIAGLRFDPGCAELEGSLPWDLSQIDDGKAILIRKESELSQLIALVDVPWRKLLNVQCRVTLLPQFNATSTGLYVLQLSWVATDSSATPPRVLLKALIYGYDAFGKAGNCLILERANLSWWDYGQDKKVSSVLIAPGDRHSVKTVVELVTLLERELLPPLKARIESQLSGAAKGNDADTLIVTDGRHSSQDVCTDGWVMTREEDVQTYRTMHRNYTDETWWEWILRYQVGPDNADAFKKALEAVYPVYQMSAKAFVDERLTERLSETPDDAIEQMTRLLRDVEHPSFSTHWPLLYGLLKYEREMLLHADRYRDVWVALAINQWLQMLAPFLDHGGTGLLWRGILLDLTVRDAYITEWLAFACEHREDAAAYLSTRANELLRAGKAGLWDTHSDRKAARKSAVLRMLRFLALVSAYCRVEHVTLGEAFRKLQFEANVEEPDNAANPPQLIHLAVSARGLRWKTQTGTVGPYYRNFYDALHRMFDVGSRVQPRVVGLRARKSNPEESSTETMLWFVMSGDGKTAGIRIANGEWLVPGPSPADAIVTAAFTSDGQVCVPFPAVEAATGEWSANHDAEDPGEWRIANVPQPQSLSVKPGLTDTETGFDAFAARHAEKLRALPVSWLPLRTALVFSLLSKRVEIAKTLEALRKLGPALATEAPLHPDDVAAAVATMGLQDMRLSEILAADAWAQGMAATSPSPWLLDEAELRRCAYETGLPLGIGIAKACFTLSLIGNDLPCLDVRIIRCAYGDRASEAERALQSLGRKSRVKGTLGVPVLSSRNAIDDYMSAARQIFDHFAFADPSTPFYLARSQWALWERCPVKANTAQTETHSEFFELFDEGDDE